MNDCCSALAILRQARDILAQRLAERILEMREEVLDDAHGHTYCGEIDAIYDQIAVRLQHVNAMIANLPAAEPPSPALDGSSDRSLSAESGRGAFDRVAGLDSPRFAGQAPHPVSPLAADRNFPAAVASIPAPFEAMALPAPVSFELFLRQIAEDDIDSAARSLAILFAIDGAAGRRCALVFQARCRRSADGLATALKLPHELRRGNVPEALRLLRDCFGLQGIESIGVAQTLRARLVGLNEAL